MTWIWVMSCSSGKSNNIEQSASICHSVKVQGTYIFNILSVYIRTVDDNVIGRATAMGNNMIGVLIGLRDFCKNLSLCPQLVSTIHHFAAYIYNNMDL